MIFTFKLLFLHNLHIYSYDTNSEKGNSHIKAMSHGNSNGIKTDVSKWYHWTAILLNTRWNEIISTVWSYLMMQLIYLQISIQLRIIGIQVNNEIRFYFLFKSRQLSVDIAAILEILKCVNSFRLVIDSLVR